VWHHLAHLTVSPWEKVLRTVAVYLGLLLLLRVGGKRQLAQMNTFDLIVLLLLSNVVQNAIIGDDNSLAGGLLGAVVLVGLNYLLVRATFLHSLVSRVLQGSPTPLVTEGQLDERALHREMITQAELEAALRRQGMSGLDDVDEVVLEPEGSLSATQKPQPSLQDVLDALERIEARLG
jgi:uncharacterized membrane protein YcaP (DUF421 family)